MTLRFAKCLLSQTGALRPNFINFNSFVLAHIGFIVFITGIIVSTRYKTQSTQLMHSGYQLRLGNSVACLRSIDQSIGPTYRSLWGNLVVNSCTSPHSSFVIFPEKRFYFGSGINTKVAIHTNWLSDLYCLIGTGSHESGWFLTIMELPFIGCIWFGFFLAALAGLTSCYNQILLHKLRWI